MARLWEDTLVIAIRDAQWIKAMKGSGDRKTPSEIYPQTFVKLDGNAERDMGDLIFEADTRFFLFEVKPTRSQIKDEWVKRGKFKPKLAYRTLKSLTEKWLEQGANMSVDAQWMEASLRCHHFVWWCERQISTELYSNILIQPYIDAAIQTRLMHGPTILQAFPPTPYEFMIGVQGINKVTAARYGSLSLIYQDIGRVIATGVAPSSTPPVKGSYWSRSLGLLENDFQRYVNYLCEQSSGHDEAIHAIVLSSCGRFMKVFTRTSQLANIFSPSPSEKYKPTPPRTIDLPLGSQFAPTPPDADGSPPRNTRSVVR